jgi:hypothetical protein
MATNGMALAVFCVLLPPNVLALALRLLRLCGRRKELSTRSADIASQPEMFPYSLSTEEWPCSRLLLNSNKFTDGPRALEVNEIASSQVPKVQFLAAVAIAVYVR